jgi:chorismate synthase
MYRLGKKVVIDLFGKSHGPCVGCILEGIPAGLHVSNSDISEEMALRRPHSAIGTARREPDKVIVGSGIVNGRTDGGPILLTIANTDTDDSKYEAFRITPRPGHADLPALKKFKDFDINGGGQFSGRMTAPLVAAGAIAKKLIACQGISVAAFSRSIGNVIDIEDRTKLDALGSRAFRTRACNDDLDKKMAEDILSAANEGDSVGGVVECITDGLPIGFGGIWFEALDSELARAIFSIPAVKGVEFGKGFALASMRGSQSNDPYIIDEGKIITEKNDMGGIVGGMSDGMPMVLRAAFKPTPSITKEQRTVDLQKMENSTVIATGRHDPCIVPRAVAVVEAMTALVVADQMMRGADGAR